MNHNPEQLEPYKINALLRARGWLIQDKGEINLHTALGVAVHVYRAGVVPADNILFVERLLVGVIEANVGESGFQLITAK